MRLRLIVNLAVALGLTAVLIDVLILAWGFGLLGRNEGAHAFGLASATALIVGAAPAADRLALLERLAARSGQVLVLLDEQGQVLWSSDQTALDSGAQLATADDARPPAMRERWLLYRAPLATRLTDGPPAGGQVRPPAPLPPGLVSPSPAAVGVLVDVGALWRRVLVEHRALLGYLVLDLLVVLLFASFLIGRLVLRPLARLNAAVGRLRFDDPLFAAASAGGDEVATVGRAVARLTRQLEDDKRAIAAQLAALERAQQGLVQHERLAVAGRLAAGLAHDIGNPLGIAQGYLALLTGAGAAQQAELIGKCERELARIHVTIGELLSLARPIQLARAPLAIGPYLEAVLARSRDNPRLSPVVVELGEAPGPAVTVSADRLRLDRALDNLLANAADACASTGAPSTARRGRVRLSARATAERVEIRVCDDGPGVPPPQRAEILQPFVSSKPVGKGTGLGLYTARQIASLHGGDLALEDSPLGGLGVLLWLPRV